MDQPRKLLTISEAARQAPLTVSENTLRRAIRRGDLEARLLFGKYRLEQTAVERFLGLADSRKGAA